MTIETIREDFLESQSSTAFIFVQNQSFKEFKYNVGVAFEMFSATGYEDELQFFLKELLRLCSSSHVFDTCLDACLQQFLEVDFEIVFSAIKNRSENATLYDILRPYLKYNWVSRIYYSLPPLVERKPQVKIIDEPKLAPHKERPSVVIDSQDDAVFVAILTRISELFLLAPKANLKKIATKLLHDEANDVWNIPFLSELESFFQKLTENPSVAILFSKNFESYLNHNNVSYMDGYHFFQDAFRFYDENEGLTLEQYITNIFAAANVSEQTVSVEEAIGTDSKTDKLPAIPALPKLSPKSPIMTLEDIRNYFILYRKNFSQLMRDFPQSTPSDFDPFKVYLANVFELFGEIEELESLQYIIYELVLNAKVSEETLELILNGLCKYIGVDDFDALLSAICDRPDGLPLFTLLQNHPDNSLTRTIWKYVPAWKPQVVSQPLSDETRSIPARNVRFRDLAVRRSNNEVSYDETSYIAAKWLEKYGDPSADNFQALLSLDDEDITEIFKAANVFSTWINTALVPMGQNHLNAFLQQSSKKKGLAATFLLALYTEGLLQPGILAYLISPSLDKTDWYQFTESVMEQYESALQYSSQSFLSILSKFIADDESNLAKLLSNRISLQDYLLKNKGVYGDLFATALIDVAEKKQFLIEAEWFDNDRFNLANIVEPVIQHLLIRLLYSNMTLNSKLLDSIAMFSNKSVADKGLVHLFSVYDTLFIKEKGYDLAAAATVFLNTIKLMSDDPKLPLIQRFTSALTERLMSILLTPSDIDELILRFNNLVPMAEEAVPKLEELSIWEQVSRDIPLEAPENVAPFIEVIEGQEDFINSVKSELKASHPTVNPVVIDGLIEGLSTFELLQEQILPILNHQAMLTRQFLDSLTDIYYSTVAEKRPMFYFFAVNALTEINTPLSLTIANKKSLNYYQLVTRKDTHSFFVKAETSAPQRQDDRTSFEMKCLILSQYGMEMSEKFAEIHHNVSVESKNNYILFIATLLLEGLLNQKSLDAILCFGTALAIPIDLMMAQLKEPSPTSSQLLNAIRKSDFGILQAILGMCNKLQEPVVLAIQDNLEIDPERDEYPSPA